MSSRTWSHLTETGSNSRMGKLLRCYWWPIAGVSELRQRRVMPVRLLSEDLVLFEQLDGTLGLLERQCPHRRADLSNGFVEQHGIRCAYHGWAFDSSGMCIEAPYEDQVRPGLCTGRIRCGAYQVREMGGIVWAYLGKDPTPQLPDWEFFHWENGFRQIVVSQVPCNWLQLQENSVDPVHFEWQHSNYVIRKKRMLQPAHHVATHVRLAFEEFQWGIVYKRLRSVTDRSDPLWATGRVCLWPCAVFPGNHVEFRVPVDDTNTLSVCWFFDRVPLECEPYQQLQIPTWRGPVFENGRCIDTHIINQDFMAVLGQGPIADRSRETLGASDAGIAMLRRRFDQDLSRFEADGTDPKGVIRDPAQNQRITLPVADRNLLLGSHRLCEMLENPYIRERLRGFIFQAGQPEEVRESFQCAMGLRDVNIADSGPVDLLDRRDGST